MLLSHPRPLRPRRGIAAVEFAVLAPVLLILIGGVWELGRMIEVQQLLTNAAREGGRQASTGARTSSEVVDSVRSYLQRAGLNTSNLTVQIDNLTNSSRGDPKAAKQMDRFRVTVTIPFNDVRWLLLNWMVQSGTMMNARAEWYSMNDLPLTISTVLPIE